MPQRSCLLHCLGACGTHARSAATPRAPRSKLVSLVVLLVVLAATMASRAARRCTCPAACARESRLAPPASCRAGTAAPRASSTVDVGEYLNYEFPYLFGRVLGGVRGRCGCWLRVLPRAQLLRDAGTSGARSSSAAPTPTPGRALRPTWRPLGGRPTCLCIGLVHLGDEHLVDDVAAYAEFGFVLRNYVREGLPRGAAVAGSRWAMANLLLPGAEALRTPASARRLLWSWSGEPILPVACSSSAAGV